MKLIDKDALVAEIERKIKTNKECMLGLRNLDYYQGKVDALNDINSFLDTLEVKEVQEEPVSEELEKEMDNYLPTVFSKDMDNGEPRFTTWFKALRKTAIHFAKWQKENLWKPADGDDLPEIDMEVIALLDNGKVAFAHRPNPDGWDAKSIITEKVERYIPKTYGKGGWNIPDVAFWLDVELPKEIEL